MTEAPSVMVTEPVGVPAADDTVAVMVTAASGRGRVGVGTAHRGGLGDIDNLRDRGGGADGERRVAVVGDFDRVIAGRQGGEAQGGHAVGERRGPERGGAVGERHRAGGRTRGRRDGRGEIDRSGRRSRGSVTCWPAVLVAARSTIWVTGRARRRGVERIALVLGGDQMASGTERRQREGTASVREVRAADRCETVEERDGPGRRAEPRHRRREGDLVAESSTGWRSVVSAMARGPLTTSSSESLVLAREACVPAVGRGQRVQARAQCGGRERRGAVGSRSRCRWANRRRRRSPCRMPRSRPIRWWPST